MSVGQSDRSSLPPTHRRVLNALERDGQLTASQLIVRVRPVYPEAARSVIRQLRDDGWIECPDD